MPQQININTIKTAIQTRLLALTWQPTGTTTTTNFVGGVYLAETLKESLDSPWAFIIDKPHEISSANRYMGGIYNKITPIEISVVSAFNDNITGETSESIVISAYEAVEREITSQAFADAMLDNSGNPLKMVDYETWTPLDNPDGWDIKGRTLTIKLLSRV